jgi:3-hydroxyisobutyrate dehydrogenase-like beta-hydroxyacid dehydrogenase
MDGAGIRLGLIGLGEMGGRMAPRLVDAGYRLGVFDAAGTKERAPEGAEIHDSVADVARNAELMLLSLPDGRVVDIVVGEIAATDGATVTCVADHSTIGSKAAAAAHAALAAAGIAYLDAPVSGGARGAESGGLAMMLAGDEALIKKYDGPLAAIAKNRFHVGPKAGQGQVMKLLNNMLSGAAMTATAEAVVYGEAHGLDLAKMIEVLNVSTGQNTATKDKYPNRIIPGTFDAGFTVDLLSKDVDLFLAEVLEAGTGSHVGTAIGQSLRAMKDDMPGEDFTRIYQFQKNLGRNPDDD